MEFDNAALDAYTVDHADIVNVFRAGLDAAAQIFGYDNGDSADRQFRSVRQNITIYNAMMKKDMDEDKLDQNTDLIITAFRALYAALE